MRWLSRGWEKKERAILGRIENRVGVKPIAFDAAWLYDGWKAPSEPHLAGSIGALGLFFLRACADSANDGQGTRYFDDAVTTETGERAALWLAHVLAYPFPESPRRPAFDHAYAMLQARLPIPESDVRVIDEIVERGTDEYGFDPRNIYSELAYSAIGMVVGPQVDELPGFAAQDHFEALNWGVYWGHGNRYYFKLVEPSGYAEWAQDKDLD